MEIVDPKQPCLPLRYQRCVPDMKAKVVPKKDFLQTKLTDYYPLSTETSPSVATRMPCLRPEVS